ncbi:MAG: MlaC/ttg2D family ABC transporter substrate-binding protein [Paracoccaceae bacterium]
MPSDSQALSRRAFGAGLAAGTGFLAFAVPVRALTTDQARGLIDTAISEINAVINSGKTESAMFKEFERIFATYADVPIIARTALGVDGKRASPAQMASFIKAFQGYISRKYGRRFREFVGGRIEVTDAQPMKSWFEVVSIAHLQGEAPFDLRWWVSDKSGKNLFFNILIEGVNMRASEAVEIRALLDRNGGDLDALIAEMNTL